MIDTTIQTTFTIADLLRVYAGILQKPVIALLILLILCAVALLGWMTAEFITERRHLKVKLPQLLDRLHSEDGDLIQCINDSGLLKRQKDVLLELTQHPDFGNVVREALAVRLVEHEQARYDKIVKFSELLARLGPMLGLLGTLIPLGPGIIALGQGDTYTLSKSLLTAFDTTIAGLSVAVVATIISTIRRSWYREYMSILEVLAQTILEMELPEIDVRCDDEAV
jgi:biopolymer transport protein ExbB/TolQ